jgi:hemoglobin
VNRFIVVTLIVFACARCASTPQTTSTSSTSSPPAESSAGAATAPAASGDKTLYERLGGKAAIEAVVDEFLKNVANDARIAHRFALTDLKDLRNKLVDLVCGATGGPCKYTGVDMKTAHRGQRIKSADFDALVEDLIKALDTFKVPDREKGELLGALAAMKPDIVEE